MRLHLCLQGPLDGTDFVFEDPFLFFDEQAQRWRCLVHQYNRNDPSHQILVGGAAVSLTPDLLGPWHLQRHSTPAYTVYVNDTEGGREQLSRRERPKLLMDASGRYEYELCVEWTLDSVIGKLENLIRRVACV